MQSQNAESAAQYVASCVEFYDELYRAVDPNLINRLNQQCYLAEQVVETLNGPREYRVSLCYATPRQLDEMARKTGLRLRERWSNWQRKPYTPSDHMHVSAYVRA
ncbi:MAG: hypothetical protein M3Q91_13600 [Acidobacteriota bacterium]|nr:hypothetical protein [Acidobacteriota bacterium]